MINLQKMHSMFTVLLHSPNPDMDFLRTVERNLSYFKSMAALNCIDKSDLEEMRKLQSKIEKAYTALERPSVGKDNPQ